MSSPDSVEPVPMESTENSEAEVEAEAEAEAEADNEEPLESDEDESGSEESGDESSIPDDDESEPEIIAPITDSREVSFKIASLNPFIRCSLCDGYLREAYTINICLHTFCKICLKNHLEQASKGRDGIRCGRKGCGQFLVTADPLRTEAKFDRAIQNLVDKLLPQFQKADEELKRQLLEESGGHKRLSTEVQPKKRRFDDTVGGEFLIFELEPSNSSVQPLARPFIKTSTKVTIRVLKKYLLQSLDVKVDSGFELSILCLDELLGPDHSIGFVKKTRWLDQAMHMKLQYKIAPLTI